MSAADVIQAYYDEQQAVVRLLYDSGQVSLAQTAQNMFAKSLVIVSASQFEHSLRDVVIRGIKARAKNDAYVVGLCMRKGIDRQYHTWFRWEDGNANMFFSLFGREFGSEAHEIMKTEPEIQESMKSFVRIGDLRNQIIHNDFLSFVLNSTAEEVLADAKRAVRFVDLVERIIDPERKASAAAVIAH